MREATYILSVHGSRIISTGSGANRVTRARGTPLVAFSGDKGEFRGVMGNFPLFEENIDAFESCWADHFKPIVNRRTGPYSLLMRDKRTSSLTFLRMLMSDFSRQ